ncbi:SRPBCC family protein [Actinoplanes sp. L3-i22]|uniref:SRPBCC family protein n=1 Tax=Actinoplanes sp. L3-i22 TaxID=2836373 RepID=UPI001C747D9D|nr:SRPBCC family protein [Actinoplanes sp. L3-i22]BCY08112.1 activator of HSP90 ATPase [Actinoplanes sp. L3-i22]
MELGTIEREIYVDATPEVVFEVVSSAEHLKGWWPDDADYAAVAGASGTISFGKGDAEAQVEQFTVVDAQPPRMFSFRWTHPAGETATAGNSLLVTFDLTPSGGGTTLRMTETGFRERGWSQAVLEECYRDHVTGWDHFIPRLAPYVATLQVQP